MEYQITYIVLAAIFGGFMAWGIGANDVANAMATSVGSKAITIKQAIIIAAIFEFAGAVLAGGEVTSTIRKGIIDAESLGGNPELLIYGMLASLLAAGIWLMLASKRGWPVSTTHSIVGAVVGFAWLFFVGCCSLVVNSLFVRSFFVLLCCCLCFFKHGGIIFIDMFTQS